MTKKFKLLTCDCLHCLKDNDYALEAIARYMLYFFTKSKTSRQEIIVQWIRYTAGSENKTPFFVPFLINKEEDDDIIVDATEGQT